MKIPEFKEVQVSEEEFKKWNRRSFIKAAAAAVAGVSGLYAIWSSQEERGMPRALRAANTKLGAAWNRVFSNSAKLPPVSADGTPIRINGDIGMLEKIDPASYKLKISDHQSNPREVSLDEIKNMASCTESFEFKCIEGWSRPVSCKGVRFSDFMKNLNVGANSEFAGMSSIDGDYYVSWDIKSLMHPQTILCYEMNGAPLAPENGEPLRILASVKYGVKQIKQIGEISFTNEMPADYWAEQGYDDYLGL
jgi:DMSO/TMAO reductase YedYZ molybdopterin-dependent catalytic subunit